jgi:hypothetical protein
LLDLKPIFPERVGVAVLAAAFSRSGVYSSPQPFTDGFSAALWVGAGLSLVGMLAAMLMPGQRAESEAIPDPALAIAAEQG